MMRIQVRGDDSHIDMADEVVDESIPIVKKAANEVGDAFLLDIRSRLRRRQGPGSAPAGESPAEQTGELARGMRRLAARVRGRVISSGVRHTSMTFEEINSIEYGAVGPNGRVSKARPFARPAEEALEKKAAGIFEREL